ncbi:hypothetical protein MHUMG1_02251 [Metarhizium humberi]|uniref:Uncharacterized protein n=1 Tax=Metarhizium humberi TaxID=2596975 RepID=A0A9P8SAH2_9HYPO|nr:hypothetical protein MHUMG1_02251 [Metarhizium humberi]
MVRFNFISCALAAQGLQAVLSRPRNQLEPLTRDASQPAQDAHDTAQQIVDDGEDNFNKGKNEGVGDELLHG